MEEPTRTTFSSIDDGAYSTVSYAIDPWSAGILLAMPVVGSVLGWLAGVLAGRAGWVLSRTRS